MTCRERAVKDSAKKRPRECALSRGLVSVNGAQTLAKVCLWPRHRLGDRSRWLGVIPKTRIWHRGEVVTDSVNHHDGMEFIRNRGSVNLKYGLLPIDSQVRIPVMTTRRMVAEKMVSAARTEFKQHLFDSVAW